MTEMELREIKVRNRYKLGCGRAPTKRDLQNDIKLLLQEIDLLRIAELGPRDTRQWRECLGGGWIKGIFRENVSDLVG